MDLAAFPNLTRLGLLKTRTSHEIASSRLGVGFETLDRQMWDPAQAWPVLSALGVKWARVQSGWARCEKTAGSYDFAWLDDIVDRLLSHGVQPWISFSYGNPVHIQGMNTAPPGLPPSHSACNDPFGVGFPPIHTAAARGAWQAYVRALVRHFRGRVTHYEVWNEPDLTSFWKCGPRAADYVDLVRLTAGPLREEQPGATLIAGAIAWGQTVWSLKFLEDCLRAGMGDLIDIVSYHGYKSVPERHSQQEIAAFTHLLRRYNPRLRCWQGEAGMQSHVPEKAKGVGALSAMKNTEPIQARMLLRRFLLELHNGTGMCSWFHMADFAHYAQFKETFHYGLVRLADGSPKPAYTALQTLATLLCDPAEPAAGRTACHMSVLDDTDDPRATKVFTWHANFVRGGVPIHAWWIPDSLEDDPVQRRAEMNLWVDRDLALEQPVIIDPLTQEVFALPLERDRRTCAESWMHPDPAAEGVWVLKPVPVSTSPLLLTDRSLIDLR